MTAETFDSWAATQTDADLQREQDDYAAWHADQCYGDAPDMPWDGATEEDAEEVRHDLIAHDASTNPLVQEIVRAALVVISRGGEAAEILRPTLDPLMAF